MESETDNFASSVFINFPFNFNGQETIATVSL